MNEEKLSRRERERLARRNDILAAARKVFAAKGYDRATLDEIAGEAEFAKGTLYGYFDNKLDLFISLIKEEFDEVRVSKLGAWRYENPMTDVTLDQLKERDTCTVYVERTDAQSFSGRTRGKECIPNNDYVDYAVFERWYMKDEMRAWDRGFSEGDIHLVGPVDGPYIFEKTAAAPIHLDEATTEMFDPSMLREATEAEDADDG